MRHDLDPMSYLQGQGYNAHITKIRVQAITPYYQVGLGPNFTVFYYDPKVVAVEYLSIRACSSSFLYDCP